MRSRRVASQACFGSLAPPCLRLLRAQPSSPRARRPARTCRLAIRVRTASLYICARRGAAALGLALATCRDALSCAPQPRAASRILCIYAVRSSPCCVSLVSDPTRNIYVLVAVLPPSRRLPRCSLPPTHACAPQPRACAAYVICAVYVCAARSSPCCVGRLRVAYMCAVSVDNYVSCVAHAGCD